VNNTILSTLSVGSKFIVADLNTIIRMGINPDQQPFVVFETNTPVKEYFYVKDKNGIMYLMGPGTLSCQKCEDSQGEHRA
jgi:hypothetical protein